MAQNHLYANRIIWKVCTKKQCTDTPQTPRLRFNCSGMSCEHDYLWKLLWAIYRIAKVECHLPFCLRSSSFVLPTHSKLCNKFLLLLKVSVCWLFCDIPWTISSPNSFSLSGMDMSSIPSSQLCYQFFFLYSHFGIFSEHSEKCGVSWFKHLDLFFI